jgi:hypothetical protein
MRIRIRDPESFRPWREKIGLKSRIRNTDKRSTTSQLLFYMGEVPGQFWCISD